MRFSFFVLLVAAAGCVSSVAAAGWRFEITPIGGRASCSGKLRFVLSTATGKLNVGGNSCNENGKYVVRYNGAIHGNLIPITYNGHREECGNSQAGFYVEGWTNPSSACFKLTRRHFHGLFNKFCSNKERYTFKVEVFNNNNKQRVNFKDSSEISCPSGGGTTNNCDAFCQCRNNCMSGPGSQMAACLGSC